MITRRMNQVEKAPTTGDFIVKGHNDFFGRKIIRCSILDGTILVLDENGVPIAGVESIEELTKRQFHEYSIWVEREELTQFQRDQLTRNVADALAELYALNDEFDLTEIIEKVREMEI